jgi:hypothetical protein
MAEYPDKNVQFPNDEENPDSTPADRPQSSAPKLLDILEKINQVFAQKNSFGLTFTFNVDE